MRDKIIKKNINNNKLLWYNDSIIKISLLTLVEIRLLEKWVAAKVGGDKRRWVLELGESLCLNAQKSCITCHLLFLCILNTPSLLFFSFFFFFPFVLRYIF